MKKLLLSSLSVMCIALVSNISLAMETIRLNKATITYESGSLDPETLNGQARGMTVKFDNGNMSYIDDFTFKTTSENGQTIVDTLDIKGFSMEDGSESVVIESINLNGLIFPKENMTFNDLDSDPQAIDKIKNLGQLTVNNIDVFESGNQVLHIDAFMMESNDVDIPVLPDVPVQDVVIDMRNFIVYAGDNEDKEFMLMMSRLGIENLTMNMRTSSTLDVKSDRVDNQVFMELDIEGMGRFDVLLDIGMLNSSLQIFNAAMERSETEIADELMALLISGGLFNQFEFSLQDRGLLAILLDDYAADYGVPRDEVANVLMDQAAVLIGSYAPTTFAMVSGELRSFLEEGGTLTIALNPPSPTVLSSFIGFAAVPDTAAEALGLIVTHQP